MENRILSLEESMNVNRKIPLTELDFIVLENDFAFSRLATSFDGNLYGLAYDGNYTRMFRTTDLGKTFEFGIRTMDIGYGGPVSINVFRDGSVAIATKDGYLLHLDSFDTSDITVVENTGGGGFEDLSVSSYEDENKKIVLAGEYSHTSHMKKIWISEDGGESYRVLKEGDTLSSGNNHWHCVVYDPYSDGIWASQGDGLNARTYYTPDYGETWEEPILGHQPTLIKPFKDRVIFGEDSSSKPSGFFEWVRSDERPIVFRESVIFSNLGAYNYYPTNTNWYSDNPDEYYMNFPPRGAETVNNYLYATGDGGNSWHLVYNRNKRIFDLTSIGSEFLFAIGEGSRLMKAKKFRWD